MHSAYEFIIDMNPYVVNYHPNLAKLFHFDIPNEL